MIISDTAVRQRVSVLVLAFIIIVFGLYSYFALPRESTPDITIPFVFISTDYKGVSASDIETTITIPIEKKLKGLEGVKKMRSLSSEGSSSISIEFITGTDIDDALQKVKNKVDEAKNDLPHDLEEDPSVFEVNFSEIPIVTFSISGTCGNPCLKDIADDLSDDIEAIPGVLEVEVSGGLEREIRVEVLPEKLAYYGISIAALQRVVMSENVNTSGGTVHLGDGRYQLKVPGEFRSPEEIFGLVVGTHQGQPVYLKDVATVVDDFKEEQSRTRLDGVGSVSLAVKKRAGENVIHITDEIDRVIAMRSPSWPQGTRITKLMDMAKDIRLMVADLENNMLTGLLLVLLVIPITMGIRNAVLVSLAIPFSMLMSFGILHAMGYSLNNVVLFSLILAVGMLVDNAIVIIENIYRHMNQGVPRIQACMKATSEVAFPVIGSTLTTLVAFGPMIFWPGIMGEFMKYLPITLIVTLSSSLFVALVINPAMAAFFIKPKEGTVEHSSSDDVMRAGEQPAQAKGPILVAYKAVLKTALKHRFVVLVSSVLVLLLMVQAWMLSVGLEKPMELFPEIDPRAAYINIEPPEGADIEYSDRLVRQAEGRVNGVLGQVWQQPGASTEQLYQSSLVPKKHLSATDRQYETTTDLESVDHVYAKSVAVAGGKSFFEQTSATHVAVQFLDFEERTVPTPQVLDSIRQRMVDISGAKVTVAKSEEGPPTGAPINIEISGDNFVVLGQLAKGIRGVLEKMPHVKDISDDYAEGTPTVRVTVDRQRAALFGLSTDAVGFALKTGYNGLDVSTYREAGEDYDITVKLPKPELNAIDALKELMVPTPDGRMVPLRTIAHIDYSGALGSITRIGNQRVVTVKADVDAAKIPGAVARAKAEELLKTLPLPPGYRVKFTGEFEFQKESEDFLSKAFMVALFLIFLVLVVQFNSVTQPFIIMTTVMLSLGGAFLGLAIFQQPFGIIMTGVGIISLAGVVVNNAIVLIDYTNKLRERGMSLEEAVVSAGITRLRPVFLTAATTILGLSPMITGVSYDFHTWQIVWASESVQWWKSMAVVVFTGLMMATVLTLVVVPTLYSTAYSMEIWLGRIVAFIKELYWRPFRKQQG